MNKKTELFFGDCRASVCVESNSDDDSVIFSITGYDVDEGKSKPNDEHLVRNSTTEIYIGQEEAVAILEALLETLDGDEVI